MTIALASMLCLSGPAWAGRPLVTEDAGVLGDRECEIESYAARAGGSQDSVRWAQAGCGIGFQTQLAVGAGIEKSGGARGTIASLSGKTFIRELTGEQAGVSFAYAFSGARESGVFQRTSSEFKGVVTVPYGGWLLHANLGWLRSHADALDRITWALAAERLGALGPVDLMAEAFGDDRDAPWMQLAARWALVPERIFLDASWGIQTSSHARQVSVGLKIAF